MHQEYVNLIFGLNAFLSENNFEWEKPTRCFNRIYSSSDSTIDYFLYNFTGGDQDKPSAEMQAEFKRLLNLFIQDYKISLSADVKFAQCSPVTYMPKEKKDRQEQP